MRVFISAAEPSGDRHAAELIHAIRRLCPEAAFIGVAGERMQAAGCVAIDDLSRRSAMLVGAVRLAGRAYRLIRRVGRMLRDQPVDLAVLVDSPTLHLPMAKQVRRSGSPILYYIAPQLWAWAPWRIGKVRRRVDRLAAILPFEEEYFSRRGVEVHYVGHPLVAQLAAMEAAREEAEHLPRDGFPTVACLPGSRNHVIREVLPGQIDVARQIAARYPEASFIFAAAHDDAASLLTQALGGAHPPGRSGHHHPKQPRSESDVGAPAAFKSRIVVNRNRAVLAAADLALCASGTATLEVAWHRLPMVVMYNGSKWGYRLVGRWLVRTPHLSLVNILAGRRIVPEFMPYYTSTQPIAAEALDLLENTPRREQMRVDLDAVIRSLGTRDAALETARMAMEMIRGKTAARER